MRTKLKKWLAVAVLAAAGAANMQVQAAQLVTGWDFNTAPSGGELRSADGQYTAVVVGDAIQSDEGRPNGGGRGFDVSEANAGYLLLEAEGTDNPMNIASEEDQVTVVVWQKNFSNINSSTFWAVSETQGRHFQFHIPWSNGIIYFDTMGCCTNPTQRLNQAPADTHDWEEAWHHYAFVKDGAYKAIYVDGELLIEVEGADPLSTDVTALYIGAANDENQPDAVIDDFAIFKGALTQSEIQLLANGESPFTPPPDTDEDGLPDYWEEQYGFDINDASDATADPDGDGDNNLAEFEKGTHPNDTTAPSFVSVETDCSLNTITMTFSEKLDEASATDPGNYTIDPSVAIESITHKKGVITITTAQQDPASSYNVTASNITTAQQDPASSYNVTASNITDESKNSIPDNSGDKIFTCVETTEGILTFKAWFGVTGTDVVGLFDDGRYPNDWDLMGPVFSFNSRDIFPNDSNNNFGAVIEGWITPEESGDYDFFLRSDDASELWISTDDSEGNLQFQAEEPGCCNAFLEVGADQTTFTPVSMTAGEKYFVQVLYKEGGGGDFAQVAWRKVGDDTPAANLQPIPGKFLSSATPQLTPPGGSFGTITPGDGASGLNPATTGITVRHNNGPVAWTDDNTSLALNGAEVETTLTLDGKVATLTYMPSELWASGQTVTATLTYPDPVGDPATMEWSFSILEYAGPTLDNVAGYPGLVIGAATSTADGGGRSGQAGDRGLDLTPNGGSVIVTESDFLNPLFAADEITVVLWSKKYGTPSSSAFWIANSAGSGNRGFQAHLPWSNGQIYFDTQGCCNGDQRLNGPIADFDDNPDFWSDWHLYSFSKKGDTKEIRIDGDLFLDITGAAPLTADVTGLFIGSDAALGNVDQAVYDDFSIFSTALGEADLKAIVGGGSPSAIDSLVAHWDFDTEIQSSMGASVAILPLDGAPETGSGLDGRYWQAEPKAITSLAENGLIMIHNQRPVGTFKATGLDFQGGNDLTPITDWLQDDGASYAGGAGDMNEGIVSLTGYIRIDNPGEVAIRSESDDGSVIWIGGQKVVDNDGSHGAPGPAPDGTYNFTAAGLYPIEIAYFNGNWTNDAGEHGGANLKVLADGNPIPGALLYSASDVGATSVAASSIASESGGAGLHGAYWTTEPKGLEFGEGAQGPIFQLAEGDNHGLMMMNTAPQGRFISTDVNYTGDDLTPILDWLGDDSGSFVGAEGNLDDGLIQLKGYINIATAGQHSFNSSSDDGSVVWIGNQVVVNNDGGHGAPGPAPDGNAFFPVAGLYPIEVAYFNGDWTNDAGDHGGANINLTMDGASLAGMIQQPVGGLPAVAAPISISMADGSVVVTFGGTLMSSDNAAGPYTPVDGATSPYTVAPDQAAQFFIAE